MIGKPARLTQWLLLSVALTVWSCQPDLTDSSEVMEARFLDRTQALTGKVLNGCREDILKASLLRADSLIAARNNKLRRVEGRPPRPFRPGAPPPKQLSAALPLRPLFPFEVRFDTLLQQQLLQDSLRTDSLSREMLNEFQ